MSSDLFSLLDLYSNYKNWIRRNPQTASDFESAVKWISYFIAGRINNSQIVSELVYSLSNLLVLFNDRIIRQSQQLQPCVKQDQLKVWLTVLEHSEVFLELSALQLWGNRGKWLMIACIQVFKCISRILLIFYYKENVIEHPPLPILHRQTVEQSYTDTTFSNFTNTQVNSISFALQHSGKIIRKVDSSPPIEFRNWKPLEQTVCDNKQMIEQSLVDKQKFAETLYIVKPILHLASIVCFGNNTWKPWMTSLVIDLYSLHLYQASRKIDFSSLTHTQRLQISRRTVALLLYFLRSPFYENHSKQRLNTILKCLSDKIPLVHLICNPLMHYIPFWQKNIFLYVVDLIR